ncbi:MAG TPA: hypothetical protein VKU00_28515 [Chthonomonadaceae bacterium]|nr:hypothetical protein [Chthonomonadaceae bacterium]
MAGKPPLTVDILMSEARAFAEWESQHQEPLLYWITDGKAVGTYLEQKFRTHLQARYAFVAGNSATGIDLPELGIDFKTTSIRQPQSSCPFQSARQKIYGLGYSLLIFVYDKRDDPVATTANLQIRHVIYVDKKRTGDYQTTTGLLRILDNDGNEDDILAFLSERMLPVDDIQAQELAQQILRNPTQTGYLTISNALQWRLQYTRVIGKAGEVEGIIRVL